MLVCAAKLQAEQKSWALWCSSTICLLILPIFSRVSRGSGAEATAWAVRPKLLSVPVWFVKLSALFSHLVWEGHVTWELYKVERLKRETSTSVPTETLQCGTGNSCAGLSEWPPAAIVRAGESTLSPADSLETTEGAGDNAGGQGDARLCYFCCSQSVL